MCGKYAQDWVPGEVRERRVTRSGVASVANIDRIAYPCFTVKVGRCRDSLRFPVLKMAGLLLKKAFAPLKVDRSVDVLT